MNWLAVLVTSPDDPLVDMWLQWTYCTFSSVAPTERGQHLQYFVVGVVKWESLDVICIESLQKTIGF